MGSVCGSNIELLPVYGRVLPGSRMMHQILRFASLLVFTLPAFVGCQEGRPFLSHQGLGGRGQASTVQTRQLQERDRRLGQLDQDNLDLQMRLAQDQQRSQQMAEQIRLLRQQLNETASLARQWQQAKQDADKKVDRLAASTRARGGATIRANRSGGQPLQMITIPGLEVRRDADVIRVALPADQLFRAGLSQLSPSGVELLDRVAAVIARNYPEHHIGIEGHTDNAPLVGGVSHHQLAAAQAQTVLKQFSSGRRFPTYQMMTVSHGANHPRVSNATPLGRVKNRRIEIVIYPDRSS